MDILQIRKKRMAELLHPSEAARPAQTEGLVSLPATTRALLGADPTARRSAPIDSDRAVHESSVDEQSRVELVLASPAFDDGRMVTSNLSGTPAPHRESARPLTQAFENPDPLDGFLARHDVVEADSMSPFAVVANVVEAPRFLTFDLGAESYAANIVDIREIIKMVHVTPVPRAPTGVLGVISKRGVVMPVVDLAAALRLRPVRRELLPDQRVLVTGEGDDVVGLRVDRVHGVVPMATGELGPVPSGVSTTSFAFFRGLARRPDGMFVVIDLAAFREHLTIAAHDGTIV